MKKSLIGVPNALCMLLLLLLTGYRGQSQDLSGLLGENTSTNTKVFSTHGLAKSQGLNLNIELPLDWEEAEAQMPNVVKQFFSPSGGDLMITVIRDNSKSTFTPNEVAACFTPQILAKIIPSSAHIVAIKSGLKLDGREAGAVTYTMPFSGSSTFDGKDKLVITRTYITFYKNYCIMLGFSTHGNSSAFANKLFEYKSPVFWKIAQTARVAY